MDKKDIRKFIDNIPFLQDATYSIEDNIYMDDKHPCCFLVIKNGLNYKLRFNSRFNVLAVQREAGALFYLKQKGCKWCPSVITSDTNSKNSYKRYVITEFLSGKSLDKFPKELIKKHRKDIVNQLIQILHEMQNISFDTFHSFNGKNFSSYSQMLKSNLSQHLFKLRRIEGISDIQASKILGWFDNNELKSSINPVFLHYDLKPQNIVYNYRTRRVALIDFEFSRFGDALHEIIRAEMKFREDCFLYETIWEPIKKSYFLEHSLDKKTWDVYLFYYYISILYHEIDTQNEVMVQKINKIINSYIK